MSARDKAAEVRPGRPQGGFKFEAGRAAYWRMQWESAIGALADLIAEHTETVEAVEAAAALADEWIADGYAAEAPDTIRAIRAALEESK